MKVINRQGDSIDISYDEIKTRIMRLCGPQELGVDIDKIVIQTINGIYDGITTYELDDLSARVCASMQSQHTAYDALASKITVSNMAKSVRMVLAKAGFANSFSGKVRYIASVQPGAYNSLFLDFVSRNAEALDSIVRYERDTGHSYFALRTMERSYLMRVAGLTVESPQDMWMRCTVAINLPDSNSELEVRPDVLAAIARCYDHMSLGDFTHATPTLFNAGTKHNLSSCYLLGTEDSLSGIFKTISDSAQISKWAGGIGVHVSNIRARGAVINSTNGTSDGIVPMLKVYNEVARYCNQAGRRKGSIAMYLEPWHADVWEFVELRRNVGAETERTRDLFLALWVPDDFMSRLEADGDWYLMTPDACPGLTDAVGADFSRLYDAYVQEGRYVRQIKARQLWQHILNCQLETGTPYILFKDHVNRKCNQNNVGTIKSSNLCAEITEYSDASEYAVCNLASIAVNRFVKEDGTLDHARLHEVTKLVTRNLNRIVDINGYPTPETRKSNMAMRPIGIGIQGLGDVYCMLKLPYDDPRAVLLDAEIMETIYYAALEASVELAAEHGPYSRYDGSPMSRGLLQFDLWSFDPKLLGAGVTGTRPDHDWDALKMRVLKSGVRNSLLTALMPTASTSQILGNCECFEPIQSNVFKRSTLAGEFLVVNRHLMADLMALGVWSDDMRRTIIARDGSVQGVPEIPEHLQRVYRTVWEVPLRSIIDHAVARGPFVDQSQSMNLFMAQPSFQKLSSALIYGWRCGLKTGMYYLRSTAAVEAIKYGIMDPKAQQQQDAESAVAGPACTRRNDPTCLACSS
jgi:ribonucleoside-diphosphate reductase alpha chain